MSVNIDKLWKEVRAGMDRIEAKNKDERIGTITSYGSAPRWAGFSELIKDICHVEGLKLDIDISKSWFRERVRFKVTGKYSALKRFKRIFDDSMADYYKEEDEE